MNNLHFWQGFVQRLFTERNTEMPQSVLVTSIRCNTICSDSCSKCKHRHQPSLKLTPSKYALCFTVTFALHTDTDSPHVHLTINSLGFDGRRFHVQKGLPQVWREQFAEE